MERSYIPRQHDPLAVSRIITPGNLKAHDSKKRIPIKAKGQDRMLVIFFSIVAALCVGSFFLLDANWPRIIARIPGITTSIGRLFILDFTNFAATLRAFGESITIATLATIYSAFIGIIFGALMSPLVTKSRIINTFSSFICSFFRAVPTVIWVLLVLVCLGFGPATGIIGLSFSSMAFFAKAFAQSFDEFGKHTVEALTAAGANRFQIFFTAILPATLSSVFAWFSLRYEVNFSESTVLGMVGAGGIGFVIASNIQTFRFGRAGVAILLVFLYAYAIEMLFSFIKKKYLMNH